MDLVIVTVLTVASATAAGLAAPPDVLRAPLVLPLALFSPGYALTSALYPRRADLDSLERLGLSCGLSLGALPLIALAVSYSPWGLHWAPLLACLSLVVVLLSALALFHRRLVPAQERFAPLAGLRFGGNSLGAALRAAAALALLAPLAALAALLLVLLAGQRSATEAPHTEFYVLGRDGRPDSLPGLLTVGQETPVTIGITNREGEEKLYALTVSINGAPAQPVAGVRLSPGQRWQRPFALVPQRAGAKQLVEFDLHMEGAAGRAYRSLYVWVDIVEPVRPPPVAALAQQQTPAPTPQPSPTPTQQPELPSPQPLVHEVAPGENLTLIARRYGVPLEAVIAINPLPNPNLIFAQQELLIPAGGTPGQGE